MAFLPSNGLSKMFQVPNLNLNEIFNTNNVQVDMNNTIYMSEKRINGVVPTYTNGVDDHLYTSEQQQTFTKNADDFHQMNHLSEAVVGKNVAVVNKNDYPRIHRVVTKKQRPRGKRRTAPIETKCPFSLYGSYLAGIILDFLKLGRINVKI